MNDTYYFVRLTQDERELHDACDAGYKAMINGRIRRHNRKLKRIENNVVVGVSIFVTTVLNFMIISMLAQYYL